MSVRAMTWAMAQEGELTPVQRLVLWALADSANEYGHCWPGHEVVARKARISERSVQRSVDALEKQGFLTKEARVRKDGGQTSNQYFLAVDKRQEGGGQPDGGGSQAVHRGVDTRVVGGVDTRVHPILEPSGLNQEPADAGSTSRRRSAAPPNDAQDVVLWVPISGKEPKKANAYLAPHRTVEDTGALGPEHGWANGGNAANEYGVREAEVMELARAYPSVDVRVRLVALREWSRHNHARRKTYERMSAWLSARLAADQNKGQAAVPFAGRDQRSPEEIRKGLFGRVDTLERLQMSRTDTANLRQQVMSAPAAKQKLLDYELRLDELIAQQRADLAQVQGEQRAVPG